MASAEPEQASTNDATTKKKPRLNPARRKSAAKANGPSTAAPVETPSLPVEAVPPSKDSTKQPRGKSQLTRTKTTPPLPSPKQSPDTPSTISKPKLARSKTAPPETGSKAKSLALKTPALVTGGLVGCVAGAAILLGVGLWYDFSGAESAILAARAAKLCVDNLAEEVIASLKAGTYSADEALDVLRRTTLAYAATIPEGAPFVERVFREIGMVRKQRGREIDRVVAETYALLAKAGVKGASAADMRMIVYGQITKLSAFASKATQDVVARNPNLRPFRIEAAKPDSVPTVRVNMAIKQK